MRKNEKEAMRRTDGTYVEATDGRTSNMHHAYGDEKSNL